MKKLIIALALVLFCITANSQERRLALVIGNANYKMNILANPVNDAADVEKILIASGFKVKRYTDLDQAGMKKVIDDFGNSLSKAEVGLFYYAGHGVQARGRNYLIPVDASLETENDVEYNCVDAGRILAKMEDAGTKTNIVILDACRDNPFERSWSRKSTGSGLAFMDAPNGSLIAYSTAPGKTASDGYGRNSPYSSALIHYMNIPNLKIEDFFKLVRVKVREKTNDQQVPWESTSLEGDFYFNLDPDYVSTDVSIADVEPGIGEKAGNLDDIDQGQQRIIDFEENRKQLAAGIRSIAIMPFANYTGDESKVYLASGLQDALISELGQLGSVRVIARTSTIQYANFQKTINEIASELNVEGVIETSLIGLGENLRIQLKLYSAFPAEQMIWSQVYDSEMNDILNLYNRVVKNIADEIQLSLTPEQESKLEESREINAQAYDEYLLGLYFMQDMSKEAVYKAMENLNSAIEKDPDWAPLYAGLAKVWIVIASFSYESNSVAYQNVYDNLDKALELDPNLTDGQYIRAMSTYLNEWNWDKSEKEFLKILAINPNDVTSRIYYAHLLSILQRFDEALTQGKLALDLDPLNPLIQALYAALVQCVGNCETAMVYYEKILANDPEHALANENMIIVAYNCGEYERGWEAEKFNLIQKHIIQIDEINKIDEIFNSQGFIAAYKAMIHHLEGLAESGNVAPINMIDPVTKAYYCYMVNQDDKAMKWLEKGFEMHHPIMPYLFTRIWDFSRLYENPRFIDIARKMNLPLPKSN
jgi:TolB-like protein